ncbi:flagellar basal-body rod protein [Campylobacter sputorum subsp. bubulus]|uniref:Flagellar basal-body rod protein n=1 Tax=Campylobacter sputorum subsp. sputorum TaxID=32024 RepID=A0A381DID9_9BACT|nr:flagellar hook-basal body protein [Campylobacter sputorum]ASM35505.1 flagellar basal body rod protein [Campylobacter sputorum aubsp. sputorum RM3237]KAB0582761.1 flagellar hook-basal body protein [Campylobacter sputorum subsp. sputorum]QEL05697.1 flagellar distal rod protein FlgF [Campylobacter sputorum subsp. sputorum]SUX08284.1 flagellar basal-body rod protein [Campylobacter sputorum subsp. bubulus]SUX10464.1 flagellar basal-body rod protein [Campylobacter sputorum subsp. sputorum]
MQNGYYQVTGAMVTQFNRLDVISNNLANTNTIGFKRDDVVIGDFERIFKETRDILPLDNHTKQAAKFLNRTIDRVPQVSEQYVDFSQGPLKHSSNPLDISMGRKDLFFLVETDNGVRLTKNGAFNIDNNGNLVTKEGYNVLPSTYFTANTNEIKILQNTEVTIDKNGNVYSGQNLISRLFVAQPREIRDLTKEGDNLYILDKLEDLSDVDNSGAVLQGYAQMSNINPVTEMVGLIQTNRLVDAYQKVMTSHMNDLNQDAIQKLASTKA